MKLQTVLPVLLGGIFLCSSTISALPFPGILTPADEFQYWAETSMSGAKASVKERAEHFHVSHLHSNNVNFEGKLMEHCKE